MAAVLAVLVLGAWLWRSPNGDPGGRVLSQLEEGVQALPDDARVTFRLNHEPTWDSCDGRKGTFGWTDVAVQITFGTRLKTDEVLNQAGATLRRLGWAADYCNPVNGGIQAGWTRVLENGSAGHLQLTHAPRSPGGPMPSDWEFYAIAPPVGQRVSGC